MSRDWHLPSLPNLGGIVKEVPDIAPRSASNRPEKWHISKQEQAGKIDVTAESV